MRPLLFPVLTAIYTKYCVAGILSIVDVGSQCMIWSNNNHGCTGHSIPFSVPKGEDCSKLGGKAISNGHDLPIVSVEACTTEKGLLAVWILLEKTGRATFFNKQGNISACTLSDGLKVGSMCDTVDLEVL
ncbi:hypothetical protein N7533_011669, partial [Penicillium manginii]|uniref:uncharacterized protein n=1 Tax=Penicillium manginii TaxID=203109 RepID=UPI002548D8AB